MTKWNRAYPTAREVGIAKFMSSREIQGVYDALRAAERAAREVAGVGGDWRRAVRAWRRAHAWRQAVRAAHPHLRTLEGGTTL